MIENTSDESIRLRNAVENVLVDALVGDMDLLNDASWFDGDTLLQVRLASDASNVFRWCNLFANDMDAFLNMDPKTLRRKSRNSDVWFALKTLLHADCLTLSPGSLKYHCLGLLAGAFQFTQQLTYRAGSDALEAQGSCVPRSKHLRYPRILLNQTTEAFGRLGYGSQAWIRRISTELCHARASTTEVAALLDAFGRLAPSDTPDRLFGELAQIEIAVLDLVDSLTRLTVLSGGLLNELSAGGHRNSTAP